MSYSQSYFGKELSDLTFADIETYFIEEREESDKIEFKSYHSHNPEEKNHAEKEKGVLRTICGLLNSEGGLIIWGAPIGQKINGKEEKVFQGKLSPCDRAIGKDSFINKVADSITPTPNGVKFQPIEKDGQFVFVIEVEQSFYSPHQFKNIYYMRMDGQTKSAPHHYIEALFRKVTFPRLTSSLSIKSFDIVHRLCKMQIEIEIKNLSKLQNEFNLYYRLTLTEGSLVSNKNQDREYLLTKKIERQEIKEVISQNMKETVYYNEPVVIIEEIYFDPNYFMTKGNESKIELFFGGKNSPLLKSEYVLKLLKPQEGFVSMEIVEKVENKYTYESGL
jgi:hypothetical protein